jgi:small subunit ribosomal protein S16
MAVTLRLTRMGAKKKPFFRIVAADSRAPRDGRLLEQLGHYNPLTEPPELKVDLERVDYWLGVGAQPSDTVSQLVAKARGQGEAAAAQPVGE